ncbi:tRNA (guanine-N(7)-)-methyltransferase, putative [Leishmania tarentolae]|uniref:tRNA (Guanine-N(7)-)-methyltransferase, putative n=1 Tax=Leishmania tarentolae TaxID=5689 RepID=A0A640KTW2_LEITA|nr:tRNA (guanine-N(7)-)-methyltransferase, putative [Leishmania tarentolae]
MTRGDGIACIIGEWVERRRMQHILCSAEEEKHRGSHETCWRWFRHHSLFPSPPVREATDEIPVRSFGRVQLFREALASLVQQFGTAATLMSAHTDYDLTRRNTYPTSQHHPHIHSQAQLLEFKVTSDAHVHGEVLLQAFARRALCILAGTSDNFQDLLVFMRIKFGLRQTLKQWRVVETLYHPLLQFSYIRDGVHKTTVAQPIRVLLHQARRNDAAADVLALPVGVRVAKKQTRQLAFRKAVGAELHHIHLLKPDIAIMPCRRLRVLLAKCQCLFLCKADHLWANLKSHHARCRKHRRKREEHPPKCATNVDELNHRVDHTRVKLQKALRELCRALRVLVVILSERIPMRARSDR